jgi:hypothetical protein
MENTYGHGIALSSSKAKSDFTVLACRRSMGASKQCLKQRVRERAEEKSIMTIFKEHPTDVEYTPIVVDNTGGVEYTPITVDNQSGVTQESQIDTRCDANEHE